MEWILVLNPNMREERYVKTTSPLRYTSNKQQAQRFNNTSVQQASNLMINAGISHYIKQAY